MTRYALIGAAGYIAPRHLQAIAATGGDLAAALDRSDSVGIMDRYFPDTAFFTEFERFEAHLADLRRAGNGVDYVGICSPNYLHASHIRTALSNGAHAICEKPLVLDEADLDVLTEAEQASGKRVYTILQLRLHPAIIALRDELAKAPEGTVHEVDVTYCTSRGGWYGVSWKGDLAKSGGIATNIGVHFFDMLTFLFGDIQESAAHLREDTHAAGWLKLERANVRWFLSIDRKRLPEPGTDAARRPLGRKSKTCARCLLRPTPSWQCGTRPAAGPRPHSPAQRWGPPSSAGTPRAAVPTWPGTRRDPQQVLP